MAVDREFSCRKFAISVTGESHMRQSFHFQKITGTLKILIFKRKFAHTLYINEENQEIKI